MHVESTEVEPTEEVEQTEQTEQDTVEGGQPEAEDTSVVVTFGDEQPPEDDEIKGPAPEWVRELRKSSRQLAKENRELKARIEASTAEKPEDLGAKPTLENPGTGNDADAYDPVVYERELLKWLAKKAAHDAREASKKTEAEKAQAEWVATQESYNQAKAAMKAEDFDDAEAVLMSIFSPTQQGIALMASANPAQMVLGLGLNPDKAKELAAIKDPVKFTAALVRLEAQMKVTTRKAPAPERTVSGTAPKSGAVDSKLKQLEEEADRTGDRSKVIAYRRSLKK